MVTPGAAGRSDLLDLDLDVDAGGGIEGRGGPAGLLRRLIDDLVVVRLEPDADLLTLRLRHLLGDLDDASGTDGAAALADGKTQALFHGDGGDELDHHLGV